MRKNKFEIEVHGGVKGVEDRGVTQSREQIEIVSTCKCEHVCPSVYMAVCRRIKVM
jgi:hypothetical protein